MARTAAIAHRDGVQRMVIAITVKLAEEEGALWIFPVPGSPDQTKLDVVDRFPQFRGVDPRTPAYNAIRTFWSALLATQIYPVVGLIAFGGEAGAFVVHEEVEKWGIHAETVSAGSAEAFAEYLEGKGMAMPEQELEAFAPYLSDEYVLIVAWVASRNEVLREFPEYESGRYDSEERWPCLYVEFATEKPFYPLRPTATYGDVHIPVHLWIVGYVKPETDERLAALLQVRYYEQASFRERAPERFMEGLPEGPIQYTRVTIRGTPARAFTDDLWFSPARPPGLRYARCIEALSHPVPAVLTCLLLLAGLSYVSGGLSGLVLYRRWHRYAKLGLWNLLTLAGFYFSLRHARDDNGEPLKSPGDLVVVFTVVFMILTAAVAALLRAPLR